MHKCLAVVHTAMNLPVPYFLIGCEPLASQEALCCMQFVVLVRRTEYSLCVVAVCVHTVLLYSTYSTYRAPHILFVQIQIM
jgi:hypothetical protein